MSSACALPSEFAAACEAWRGALGADAVLVGAGRHGRDTSRFSGVVPATLLPRSRTDVQHAIRIACEHRVPLYPLSTGRNWGYGTSVPVESPSVILDLSRMNQILGFDRDLGVVTVEPGVTQRLLREFLRAELLPFIVPVTGAGPDCSIVGNAIERGFGITPEGDHFASVMSLSAVLPDGSLYQSLTREWNSAGAANALKWGVGPYIDGLFTQSALGIVTDMSIALAPQPERAGAFFFAASADSLRDTEAAVQQMMRTAGSNIGGINLIGRKRLEAVLRGRARSGRRRDVASSGTSILTKLLGRSDWIGVGSLYGSNETYGATARLIRRVLRPSGLAPRFVSTAQIPRLSILGSLLRTAGFTAAATTISNLQSVLDLVSGTPSDLNLSLAYSASGDYPVAAPPDPARDGCGLIWYAPVIPMRSGAASHFIAFAEETSSRFGLVAPVALTAFSPRYFAGTVPLLFDRSSPMDSARADSCYRELLVRGRTLGFHPYRIGAQFMGDAIEADLPFWKTAAIIKAALDGAGVVAPGRYSPIGRRPAKEAA